MHQDIRINKGQSFQESSLDDNIFFYLRIGFKKSSICMIK